MSIHNKSILVTGGAGFIGSNLVDYLSTLNPEQIVVVDNLFLGREAYLDKAKKTLESKLIFEKEDATNYSVLERILWKHGKIDIVFDLAVEPLGVSFVNPTGVFLTDVKIPLNLCELQRKDLFKTLIHFSSSEAYGSAKQIPMPENHPLNPTTPYGAAKAAADLMLLSFQNTFDLDIAIVRPFNNYGPRQNDKEYAGLVPTTITRILNGKKPVIFGDGKQTRDYIFVEDVVKSSVLIYHKKATRGKIINIGSGKEIAVIQMVKEIQSIMKSPGKIEYMPERTADVFRHCADISLSKNLIGFKPETSIKEGLEKTIAWYIEKRTGN